MAEPQVAPLLRTPSEESELGTRRGGSNKQALKVAGLTLLATVLIVGQAFTAYMVYNQKDRLNTLESHSARLEELGRRALAVKTPMKMALPMNSLPLFLDDSAPEEKKDPSAPAPKKAVKTPMRMALPMNSAPLFQDVVATEEKKEEATPAPKKELTQCLKEAAGLVQISIPGFKPRCDKNGDYKPEQCWEEVKMCWCVNKQGAMVKDSMVEGSAKCGTEQ